MVETKQYARVGKIYPSTCVDGVLCDKDNDAFTEICGICGKRGEPCVG